MTVILWTGLEGEGREGRIPFRKIVNFLSHGVVLPG